ncbi:MAG: hypothetical protein AAGA65_21040, partial [Actinomycetota bacterium]
MIWVALLCGISVAAGFWLLVGGVRRPPPSLVLPVNTRGTGVSVATLRSIDVADPGVDIGTGARFSSVGGLRVDRSGSPVGRRRSLRAALVGDGSNWSTYRGIADDLR